VNTTPCAPSRCLLILPRGFYGFASVLTRGLAALGFDTTVANDEYPESVFGKVISKLGLRLSQAITCRELNRQVLSGQQYDLILVIKGRGLDAATVASLRQHGRSVVGYHFDSFGFDRGPARWVGSLPRVCTFDYRDAQAHGLPVVELFSSMPAAPASDGPRRYAVSAVLRNHSQRLVYLDQVLAALGGLGAPGGLAQADAFIYIYEANAMTFLANFLRHPRLYLKYRRFISRQALPYDQYVAAIAGSAFTIDYAHPKQSGITIRCFEALSAGTRIITNNPSVLTSRLFSADNTLVFNPSPTDDTRADGAALRQQLAALAGHQPAARRRTVDDFLRELIGPADLAMLALPADTAPQPIHTTP